MPSLIEDALTSNLSTWLDANRPAAIPPSIPIHVANRDELRTRPCIVVATSEAKSVSGLRHTSRLKLDIHVFSQVDDASAEDHGEWAAALAALLGDVATIQTDLSTDTFCLHDLIARETATTPDEQRGRETVLSYEAVVSAV
jgi:hypothetical protein